jgi:hypothetical protein
VFPNKAKIEDQGSSAGGRSKGDGLLDNQTPSRCLSVSVSVFDSMSLALSVSLTLSL